MASVRAAYRQLRAAVGRPSHPVLLGEGDAIEFQLIDVSVTSDLAGEVAAVSADLGVRSNESAVFKSGRWPAWGAAVAVLFGVARDGRSVCCRVHGFMPWCYVRVPTEAVCNAVIGFLKAKRNYKWVEEEHYNFAGFQWDATTNDRKKHRYLKVWATSVAAYNQLRHLPRSVEGVEVVEHEGVPLYAKFFNDSGLTPNQWVSATASATTSFHVSTCDVELVSRINLLKGVPGMDVAPLLIASCDAEMFSSTGAFPDARVATDVCYMVNASVRRLQQPTADALHLCFLFDDRVREFTATAQTVRDGTVWVLRYPSELDMLRGFRDCLCVYLDVDITMWYNCFRFDYPYVYRRALSGADPTDGANMLSATFQTSKFVALAVPLKERALSSAAMGDNRYVTYAEEHGRLTLDLYDMVCKREKMASYSLANVCMNKLTVGNGHVNWVRGSQTVTGTGLSQLGPGDAVRLGTEFYVLESVTPDGATLRDVPYDLDVDVVNQPLEGRIRKVDLSPRQQADHYRRRDFDAVIDYCTRDCVAPLRLLDVFRYYMNDHQMAQVTMTPIKDLWGRGAAIKGVNLVVKFAHERGFVLNQPPTPVPAPYQGAFVLEPTIGFHSNPVVTLDFMSLYPSIICSQSYCWTTVVLDAAHAAVPGIQYNEIEVAPGVTHRFAANVPNVCPALERLLLDTRAATKREMKHAADATQRALLDAKQLAEKVTCNAMYGLTGADTGLLKCKPLAASITAFGRQELLRTRDMVHTTVYDFYGDGKPATHVIYGDTDSVMVKFLDLPGTHAGICEAWRRGEIMARDITQRLGHNIVLECEKVYCPYLLLKKKKYAGIKYEGNPAVVTPVRDDKGLDLKKRSTSKFCRTAQRRILDCLLHTSDKVRALELMAEHVVMLCRGRVSLDDLATSASLKAEYTNTVVQDVVNRRRAAYAPGTEYKPGERVPMVAVEERNPEWGAPSKPHSTGAIVVCDIMEDVDIARATGATPHRRYYLRDLYSKVASILYDEIPALDAMVSAASVFLSGQRTLFQTTLEATIADIVKRRACGSIACGSAKPSAKERAKQMAHEEVERGRALQAAMRSMFKVKPASHQSSHPPTSSPSVQRKKNIISVQAPRIKKK